MLQLPLTRTEKTVDTSRASREYIDRLKESELRYRRLFETAQDGILILDEYSGKILDVNPFLEKILGYKKEDFLGKELWQIGVFKDVFHSKAAFLELQERGYIRYEDLPLQTKNGFGKNVEFISNVYTVGSKKIIQCNIRDVSDRKSAEKIIKSKSEKAEELAKSQEQTKKAMLNIMEDLEEAKLQIEIEKAKDEAMLASIGEGLIAIDIRGQILVINTVAEDMLGWKAKNIIGHDISEFHLENEQGYPVLNDERSFTPIISKVGTNYKTYYFKKKDGVRFPIGITVTPIKLNKKIIGEIDIFRDISRENEIDRAKTEFVSLASHQLRTPLGISKWYIEAIIESKYFNEIPRNVRDYLQEIYKSNERLLALVRDLLSISRIDQGKVQDFPKSTNIPNLLIEIMKVMKVLAIKHKVALELNVEDSIKTLYIDPLRIREVIENLITNAILYSNTDGKVKVSAKSELNKILITVKDNGIGISEDEKKLLFLKFFRSEKASIKNTEGSGLGLYVVKSYVEGWGGAVSVQSEEGKGSSFTISLPIKNEMGKKTKTRKEVSI